MRNSFGAIALLSLGVGVAAACSGDGDGEKLASQSQRLTADASVDDATAAPLWEEPADAGFFTKKRFRDAAGCTDCRVLAVSPMLLPETAVVAAAAKLQGPDNRLYDLVLDSTGVIRDHEALVLAERTAVEKKRGKLSKALDEWVSSASPSDRRWVWIWTTNIAPSVAKESILSDPTVAKKQSDDIDADLSVHAGGVRKWLAAKRASIEWGQSGGPLVRAKLSASEVRALATVGDVISLGTDEYPGSFDSSPWGTSSQWGSTLELAAAHSAYGTTGARVCVKEPTQPDDFTHLSSVISGFINTSGPTSTHTRGVVGIIRNSDASSAPWQCVAPSALVYMADYGGTNTNPDDWCRTTAVTSTMCYSYDVAGTTLGPLTGTDWSHDWLAKTGPFMVVTAAAGTSSGTATYVANRGYNGLVVGGVTDQNTGDRGDDLWDTTIAYGNPQTTHSDHELPQVAAPSNSATPAGTTISGSSAGAAMVAGIASLLEGKDSSFAGWPEMKRSVIIATATGRADQGLFAKLPLSADGKIGAGVVDAYQAMQLAASSNVVPSTGNNSRSQGRWATTINFSTDFDSSSFSVARWKVPITVDGRLRVALAWDASATCTSGGNCSNVDTLDGDFDLHVVRKLDGTWDTSGTPVCSSSSWDSAWEACDIPVANGETYLIYISKHATTATATYMSLAWWPYRQYAGGPCNAASECESRICTGGKCGCVSDLDCPDRYCNSSNVCANRQGIGLTCSRTTMCSSGFCADGFCCDSACSGACTACSTVLKGSGLNGNCGNIANGTDPKLQCPQQSCSSSLVSYTQVCNGSGSCRSNGTLSCGPYQCNGTGCYTSCSSDSQCIAGDYCLGTTCVPKVSNGTACASASQCQSGFCADGYCCNAACGGTCQQCDLPGSRGSCTNVTTAKHGTCATCTFCDGSNAACVNEPSGKTCLNSTVCDGTETCNGSGSCVGGTPLAVDDGNACTSDTCDSVNGVSHVQLAAGSCPPRWPTPAVLSWTQLSPTSVHLTWPAATFTPSVSSYKIYKDGVDTGLTPTTTSVDVTGGITAGVTYVFRVQALSSTGFASTDGPSASVQTVGASVAIDASTASSFLTSGSAPPQTGVSATFDPARRSVMRGLVQYAAGGTPVAGAKVTIAGHPEYGNVLTRADGTYDLAVNGGSRLAVQVDLAGYVPVQRATFVPWDDYVVLPTVILTKRDTAFKDVAFGAATTWARATATTVSDTDGSRTARLLFQPGTRAQLQAPGGGLTEVSNLRVRATELTVGGDMQAMPGNLPERVAYTYAISLDADEALPTGSSVLFKDAALGTTQPVILYVENVAHITVGEVAPLGWYDPDRSIWVPATNSVPDTGSGRVVKLVGFDSATGLAKLAVTAAEASSSTEATSAEYTTYGITPGERAQLSDIPVGTTLMRLRIPHFSSWDANWGEAPPVGAGPPQPPGPPPEPPDPCKQNGSIIECENQVLGETFPIAGTPLSLTYSSGRAFGRDANRTFTTRLTGANGLGTGIDTPGKTPADGNLVKRIDVQWQIAGQSYYQSFAPAPNIWSSFTWDGKDAYGRVLQGRQQLHARVGYVYNAVYGSTSAFGYNAGGAITGVRNGGKAGPGGAAVAMSGGPAPAYASELTYWTDVTTALGSIDPAQNGLGGFEIDVHHVYDPSAKVLFKGSGERVPKSFNYDLWMSRLMNDTTWGGSCSSSWPATEGALARCSAVGGIRSVAVAPDGSVYFGLDGGQSTSGGRVGKLSPSGTVTTAYCSGVTNCTGPSTGPYAIQHMAVGPDGKLYILGTVFNGSSLSQSILRVDAEGRSAAVTTIRSGLSSATALAFGPDGSLYYSEVAGPQAVTRIAPPPSGYDLSVGTSSVFSTPVYPSSAYSIAVAQDGTLYAALRSGTTCGVFKQSPGMSSLQPVIGWVNPATGILASACGNAGDGGPATSAQTDPGWIALTRDGALLVAESSGVAPAEGKMRIVGSDGIIRPLAFANGTNGAYAAWEGAAWDTALAHVTQWDHRFAVGNNGEIYTADGRLWRVATKTAGLPVGSFVVADGDLSHVFDTAGRHQYTYDVARGKPIWTFGYNSANQLTTLTDRSGQVTTIAHNGEAIPGGGSVSDPNRVVVVSPFHQMTELALSGGALSSIADPAGYAWTLTWDTAYPGLLDRLVDPDGTHVFTWSTTLGKAGNLLSDIGPAGTPPSPSLSCSVSSDCSASTGYCDPVAHLCVPARVKTLSRVDTAPGWEVTVGTAIDQTHNLSTKNKMEFGVTVGTTPDLERRTFTAADGTVTTMTRDALGNTTIYKPTGIVTSVTTVPDPILGRSAPIQNVAITANSLTRTTTTTSTVTPAGVTTIDAMTGRTDTVIEHGSGSSPTTSDVTRTRALTRFASTTDIVTTTGGGFWSKVTLDNNGNPITIAYPTSAQYADISRVPYQTATSMTWDLQGRLTGISRGTRVMTWDYSTRSDGFLNYFQDAMLNRVTFPADGYDLIGRLKKATFADTNQLQMSYDSAGRVSTLTPPSRPAHAFTWTKDGNLDVYTAPKPNPADTTTLRATDDDWFLDSFPKKVTRAGGGTIDYARDLTKGTLSTLTDSSPASHVFTYSYDPTKGWVTGIASSDAINFASLTYTPNGSLPQTTAWSGGVTGTLDRFFDDHLRLQKRVIGGGSGPYETLGYGYDGQLTQVTTSPVGSTLSLVYHAPTAILTDVNLAVGATTFTGAWTYNTFAEAKTYQVKRGATELFYTDYETTARDALGRIVKKTERMDDAVNHTYQYGYDSMNRLTQVTIDTVLTETYEYGSNGTRTFATTPATGGVRTAATYDDQDRVGSFNGTTYTFQPSGEVATSTTGGVTTTYTYDGRGNLLKAQIVPPAPMPTRIIQYVVDPKGRRVGRRTTTGTATVPDSTYLYDGQLRIVAETFTSGATSYTTHYVYGTRPNVPEALIRYQTGTSTGDVYRIVTDHLGSLRLVVKSDGTVVQRMKYDAFGNVAVGEYVASGWVPVPFGFAGAIYDRDTKLSRFGARDYDSGGGIWIEKDPSSFKGGLDLYGYCAHDPVNHVDTRGRNPLVVVGGGAATAGAAAIAVDAVFSVGLTAWIIQAAHDHGGSDSGSTTIGDTLPPLPPSPGGGGGGAGTGGGAGGGGAGGGGGGGEGDEPIDPIPVCSSTDDAEKERRKKCLNQSFDLYYECRGKTPFVEPAKEKACRDLANTFLLSCIGGAPGGAAH